MFGIESFANKRRTGVLGLLLAMWTAGASLCAAEDRPADTGQYTLFKPTPRELMREMNTDRPDKTESPHTVDPGHFQIEADILNYTYDRHNPARDDVSVESVAIAPVNLKAGLCNRVDFQLVVESYSSVRTHDRASGVVETHRGFGDITPRLKWNVWGNDRGATALALMPFVKLPTSQDDLGNNSVEGGIIVPLAVELPRGWGVGLMTEFDVKRDESGLDHHVEFINSITFGHDIAGHLAGYVEFFSAVSAESGSEWIGTVDLGLTYRFTDDIQLDAGVHLGVTRSADDINPFLGVAWRF
jgi:hypothetical protein